MKNSVLTKCINTNFVLEDIINKNKKLIYRKMLLLNTCFSHEEPNLTTTNKILLEDIFTKILSYVILASNLKSKLKIKTYFKNNRYCIAFYNSGITTPTTAFNEQIKVLEFLSKENNLTLITKINKEVFLELSLPENTENTI